MLAGESERSPAMRKLRRSIGESEKAQRLLMGLHGERFNPYRNWQGPHWTLYSLAEIGFPAGDQRTLPLRQRVMDWMFAPAFLKAPSTVVLPGQPKRPRHCASMEGNTIWSHLVWASLTTSTCLFSWIACSPSSGQMEDGTATSDRARAYRSCKRR